MAVALKALSSQERDEEALRQALTRAMGRQGTLLANRIIEGQSLSLDEAERVFNSIIQPHLSATLTRQAQSIAQEVGFEDVDAINRDALEWVRSYSFDLVRQLTEVTREVVQLSLQKYVGTPGMTRRELEQSLGAAFGPARASAIAVTEVTRTYSEATNIAQRRLSESGVEMERVWRTSEDENVDVVICLPLDGKSESEWRDRFPDGPPAHVGCRCSATLQVV